MLTESSSTHHSTGLSRVDDATYVRIVHLSSSGDTEMKSHKPPQSFERRDFLRLIAVSGVGAAIGTPDMLHHAVAASPTGEKPATNIDEALKYPRTEHSMPGKYPGRVVEVHHAGSVVNNKPDLAASRAMLRKSMLALTGTATINEAWLQFVAPDDIVGLKVNPVAGKELSTSLEIVQAVIEQLTAAGVPKKNIIIWDRREFEMHEVGFTADRFPDVRIVGTECKDENGSFYDSDGTLYSKKRIDTKWYYWADCEESYDAETLPYMINEGKHSYFGSVLTNEITKVINIPILKNAGPTVTLCLKNLAYGAISNTSRLHKELWSETCAQVPCFPPLRDKVVLNIVDGMIGCYNGGPGANPQFITAFNTLLVGSDPVAVDRIGYEIILKKRLETGVQKQESPRGLQFMTMAEGYHLGIADKEKIQHTRIEMG